MLKKKKVLFHKIRILFFFFKKNIIKFFFIKKFEKLLNSNKIYLKLIFFI